ncbi:hypothetical protein [Pantoea sp. GM01]|uniref:hypothetical protein n=1 Tax=Pantoea sp. GM01 TaxID=1144320 RepID=UPI00027125CA|nr:hypothetical protein [Pantoea sp. GM01]EJL85159.1 hypothetical protein PMI17_03715 [Pantoea sp. GM01]
MKLLISSLIVLTGFALATQARASLHSPDISHAIPSILPVDSRCTLSLGAPVIDYGTQSRWQMQDAAGINSVTPGKRRLTLNVICPYSQTMRLKLNGERAANGDLRYGRQGSMTVRLLSADLDGQAVGVARLVSGELVDVHNESILKLQPGNSIGAMAHGTLARGKKFTAYLEIEPVLPEASARVTARESSQSSLSLELLH